MLKVGELFASIHLDDKDFKRGVDGAGHTFGGLVSGVAKGGLLIAGALAGVGAAGGGLALKLGGMASDLNESMSKVGVVFGTLGDDIVAWSKDSASALGLSQQAALEAAGTYGNLFRSMGLSEDASAGMSTGLVELSADLASFNNMDPTMVLDKLRAGLTGETEPLKALGVNLSAVAIEARAMEMGLADADGAISAAAKAQASYALILEQTSLAQGDFERTSGGMANQQRILGATLEDTMTRVGQAVVPIFEAVLPQLIAALSGVADWATDNGPAIQAIVEGVFTAIGAAIGALITAIGVVIEAIALVVENIDIMLPAFLAMGTMILATVIPAFVAWAVAAGGAAVATIVALAPVLAPIAAVGAAVVAIGLIWREWGDEITAIVGSIVRSVGDAFRGLGRIVGGIWDGIGNAVRGGINFVIGLMNRLIGFLNGLRISIPRITVPGTNIGIGGGSFGLPHINTIPHLAAGVRNFRGGLAVVGEQGPELVSMPRGTDVFSNGELGGLGMALAVAGPLVHIQNFTGTDAEVEDISRRLATQIRMRLGRRT